ncbi:hypothetical protein [Streptomyces virginiae]|uniref:hypothetical protein n=1 Tax=Streptomyces virginiae TaxID=1961 RepID=UPI0036FFE613
MSAAVDAREAGRRVEEVLDRLAATEDRAACEAAEELVRVLMEFYGAGLARIARTLAAAPDPVELLGFDEATGVLRLRPAAAPTGCGCGPGGAETARRTPEDTLT